MDRCKCLVEWNKISKPSVKMIILALLTKEGGRIAMPLIALEEWRDVVKLLLARLKHRLNRQRSRGSQVVLKSRQNVIPLS